MNTPNLSIYKYDHAEKLPLPRPYKTGFGMAVVLVVLSAYFFGPLSFVLMVLLAVVAIVVAPSKSIRLSPRFLLCGHTLIYYRNVDKVIMDENNGYLTLCWGDNQVFRIDRKKFPTNARKPPKIAANKAAKFSRVAEKIIAKIKAVTPTVTLICVNQP